MEEFNVGGVCCVVMLLLFAVQSCVESNSASYSDEQIMQTGQQRLIDNIADGDEIEIIHESVIRPGRNGSDFGYWVRYRVYSTINNEWMEKEHYDE